MVPALIARGLGSATDVVISGCSAGGLSTFLHADTWGAALPTAKVVALPDSGFFRNYNATNTATDYGSIMRWVFSAMNSTGGVPAACVSANSADPALCIFAENVAPTLKVSPIPSLLLCLFSFLPNPSLVPPSPLFLFSGAFLSHAGASHSFCILSSLPFLILHTPLHPPFFSQNTTAGRQATISRARPWRTSTRMGSSCRTWWRKTCWPQTPTTASFWTPATTTVENGVLRLTGTARLWPSRRGTITSGSRVQSRNG